MVTCPTCGTDLKNIVKIMFESGAEVSNADGMTPHWWCPNCGTLVYEIPGGEKIERPRFVKRVQDTVVTVSTMRQKPIH